MLAPACLGTRGKLVSAGDSSSSSELLEVVEFESSIRWLQANSSSGEAGLNGGVQR
jgi:hypothetical protein